MKRPKTVTIFSVSLIVYGVYVLLGTGAYSNFAELFRPFPAPVIVSVYLFNIVYGVLCIYAGKSALDLSEWARKAIVLMISTSVAIGLYFNRVVMSNFKHLLFTGQVEVPAGSAPSVYKAAIIIIAALTIYELSVVYFFSKKHIRELFN